MYKKLVVDYVIATVLSIGMLVATQVRHFINGIAVEI